MTMGASSSRPSALIAMPAKSSASTTLDAMSSCASVKPTMSNDATADEVSSESRGTPRSRMRADMSTQGR